MKNTHGLAFTEKTIGDVQRAVDSNPAISRRSLSRSLCELHDWRSVSGRLKEVVCPKAVSILHSRHLVRLPEVSPVSAFQIRPAHKPYQRPAVNCTLAELGDVNLLLIDKPTSLNFLHLQTRLQTRLICWFVPCMTVNLQKSRDNCLNI